jgi:hypothetical protein
MSLRKRMMVFALFMSVLVACGNNKTETHKNMYDAIPVISSHSERTLHVKHQVRGKDVFIECIVNEFTFKKGKRNKVEGEGHIDLYLNGQKMNEIFTAAFVVKGLPTGKHTIHLELVHNDSSKYGLSHEFEVNIP